MSQKLERRPNEEKLAKRQLSCQHRIRNSGQKPSRERRRITIRSHVRSKANLDLRNTYRIAISPVPIRKLLKIYGIRGPTGYYISNFPWSLGITSVLRGYLQVPSLTPAQKNEYPATTSLKNGVEGSRSIASLVGISRSEENSGSLLLVTGSRLSSVNGYDGASSMTAVSVLDIATNYKIRELQQSS